MTRYLLLFDSYGLNFCQAASLTRGRVCLLYALLALASAVFLGSEILGTRDHILLSSYITSGRTGRENNLSISYPWERLFIAQPCVVSKKQSPWKRV
jgi:hypothetical protein